MLPLPAWVTCTVIAVSYTHLDVYKRQEFLPSFLAKLVPGVDLAPLWTLSVANVYRKSKRSLVNAEERPEEP